MLCFSFPLKLMLRGDKNKADGILPQGVEPTPGWVRCHLPGRGDFFSKSQAYNNICYISNEKIRIHMPTIKFVTPGGSQISRRFH